MSRKKTHKSRFSVFAENILSVIDELCGGDKKEFAGKIMVHYDTVRRWCNGNNLPEGNDLLLIQNNYGISIDWLFTGKGNRYLETVHMAVNETPGEYAFMSDWKEDTKNACRDVKEILESDDEVSAFALRSNIAAFRDSVRRKGDITSQKKEISALKRRLQHLEKLLETDHSTGTEKAAGTGSNKKET